MRSARVRGTSGCNVILTGAQERRAQSRLRRRQLAAASGLARRITETDLGREARRTLAV